MIKSDSENYNAEITGNHETIMHDLFGILKGLNDAKLLDDIDRIAAILQILPEDNERVKAILEGVEVCSRNPNIKKFSPKIKNSYDLSALSKEDADAMRRRILEGFKARNEYKK